MLRNHSPLVIVSEATLPMYGMYIRILYYVQNNEIRGCTHDTLRLSMWAFR